MKVYFTEIARIAAPLLVMCFTLLCFVQHFVPSALKNSRYSKAAAGLSAGMLTARFVIKELFLLFGFLSEAIWLSDIDILIFGLAVTAVCGLADLFFAHRFRLADKTIMLDLSMLFAIGIVMLTRFNPSHALRQFLIGSSAFAAACVVLMLRPELTAWYSRISERTAEKNGPSLTGICICALALSGILMLALVLLFGKEVNGSLLGITVFGITFQPSEPVKAVFILFLSLALADSEGSRRKQLLVTAAALCHVFLLVLSRDLGSGGIYFVALIVLLFIATGKKWIPFAGMAAGLLALSVSAVLFSHVRVRLQAFTDPWSVIDSKGFQITQSLFAITYGGAFGAGLTRGTPSSIPFAETDFVFSAVCEELGLITGVCIILICLHVFLETSRLSQKSRDTVSRLYFTGAGTIFIIQTFLTVGGEVRFIPSTGVTLPLVSYGGSSVVSVILLFFILQFPVIAKKERYLHFAGQFIREEGKKTDDPRFEWSDAAREDIS
ncbi:MAG: FtsW/RodA/SpoVE family cell cycle protein [Lachnospiraceae bacterium]|nr:FtsW/RodA/SpoVE family cell cycle protein [Lachnospiraceae bacterium]